MKKRVFNLLIVDESGSMGVIEQQTVSGINETLQTIRNRAKKLPEAENYVTLVTFSSERIEHVYDNVSADEVQDIRPLDYQPEGCTPLYDAVGQSINHLREQIAATDSVFVTIITDGYENASRRYSKQSVRRLIEDMRHNDWVFTFIGANIDVKQTSNDLGVSYYAEFKQDDRGTKHMFRKLGHIMDKVVNSYAEEDGISLSEASENANIQADLDDMNF